MDRPNPQEVTRMLVQLGEGKQEALNRLLPIVYDELRKLAASYMSRERRDHTLQATALVHEAYFKLVGEQEGSWRNRAHFFGVAATAMRRILIDHARKHKSIKRGYGQAKVSLDDVPTIAEESSGDMIALDEALSRLAKIDQRQSRIVELRYFSGLSIAETAAVLGISPATVKRDWNMAKAWLHREIK